MPLAYTNASAPGYSEAERTFSAPQDWTRGGATTLRLYFYGSADNNVTEPMWVKLTDQSGQSGTITYGTAAGENADDLTSASWHEWTMLLADFGIDVAEVKAVSIGFGAPDGAPSGATGLVYIDDIQVGTPAAAP